MYGTWRLGCFCANSTISKGPQSRLVLLVDFASMTVLCGQSHCRKFPMLTLVVVVGWLVWVFGYVVLLFVDWLDQFESVSHAQDLTLGGVMFVDDVVVLLYLG